MHSVQGVQVVDNVPRRIFKTVLVIAFLVCNFTGFSIFVPKTGKLSPV